MLAPDIRHAALCRSLLVERHTPDRDTGRIITDASVAAALEALVEMLAVSLTDEKEALLTVQPATIRSWPTGDAKIALAEVMSA